MRGLADSFIEQRKKHGEVSAKLHEIVLVSCINVFVTADGEAGGVAKTARAQQRLMDGFGSQLAWDLLRTYDRTERKGSYYYQSGRNGTPRDSSSESYRFLTVRG